MSTFTGQKIANTYKQLLQVNTSNSDLGSTLITVQTGAGNNTPLQLATDKVNVDGTFQLGGVTLTANVSALNNIADLTGTTGIVVGDSGTIYGRTLTGTSPISITNANGVAGNPTIALTSTGITSATYGPLGKFNIDTFGRVIDVSIATTVAVNTVNAVNLSATTANFSGNVSIGGTLTMSGAITPSSVSTTGNVNGVDFNASGNISATNITVGGTVSAVDYYGDGSNLTNIVATSATNASFAASAGEAATAVSASHAVSATFATSANNATFATTATNATFALSATNATNATSATFASSATNATNAINVDYGGVVETSSANIGTVSASDIFVSGDVSVGGTFDVSGAVSIGGGLFVTGDVSAGNIYAGGILYGNGAGLFNVPSESGGTVNFITAGEGLHAIVNETTTTNPISASGTIALDFDQTFGIVSATTFAGPTITSINSLASTNLNAITSINTVVGNVSSNLATVSSTLATSIANHMPLSGGTFTGSVILNADPASNLQPATKQYVDNLTAAALHFHEAVRLESPINLTATYNNGTAGVGATLTNSGTQVALSIDGVATQVSDRILVYEQTDQTQNGVYVVTNIGSGSTNWVLTRSSDTNTSGDSDANSLDEGSYFFVTEGNTGAGESYVCNTQGVITFGTTNITFIQFSSALNYTAGTNIDISTSRVISAPNVATTSQLNTTNANVTTNLNAITSINTVVTDLSATLATSIANVAAGADPIPFAIALG